MLVRVDNDMESVSRRICFFLSLCSGSFSPFLHQSSSQCLPHAHREALAKVALADVLHCGLERRQTVAQVVLRGVTEVKVLDVAEIRHPE